MGAYFNSETYVCTLIKEQWGGGVVDNTMNKLMTTLKSRDLAVLIVNFGWPVNFFRPEII